MMTFFQIDFPALLTGTLAAVTCALVGNFLVLTRQRMLGDAMGHVVLPGIVIAFVIAGTTATWVMLGGAFAAALVSAMLVEFLRRIASVDPSAALGAVFTAMFALGVLLLEQTGIARTSFDVHHILFGNIEAAIWPAATGFQSLFDVAALRELPPEVFRLAGGLIVIALVIGILFKELRLTSFDPVFASTIGVPPRVFGAIVVSLSALAAVVSLSSVGVILLVAMMVCPPAAARMLTDDLRTQVLLSVVFALLSGISGYAAAVLLPQLFGQDISLGAAGTIAVVAGLIQLCAMLFGAKRGSPRVA